MTIDHCVQEQSSRREIGYLQTQLQSSEAIVADLKKILQEKDSELETLRPKVSFLLAMTVFFPCSV